MRGRGGFCYNKTMEKGTDRPVVFLETAFSGVRSASGAPGEGPGKSV